MKIGHKLILGFLLVALLSSFTTLTALRSYQNIDAAFVRLVDEPLPVIKALEGLKASGNRIVSSTSELSVIYSELSAAEENKEDLKSELDEEEKQLAVFGYQKYDELLKHYESLVKNSTHADAPLLEEIRKNGDELNNLSRQLVEMKKKGVSREHILELKKKFEDQEVLYFRAVDAALNHEYEQMANEQIGVHSAISESERITYLVTLLTFILAIGSGIYISRLIAGRIIKLKEASEKVGRGEFETQIEIQSSDEVGTLADSFNKMVGYLKASRAELSVAKDFTDKVLDSMVDFVVVLNMDLTISRVNKAVTKINGYEEDELIGKSVNILIADKPFNRKGVDVLRQKGHIANLDKLNLNKDGSVTPISMSLSVLKDEQGRELGIVCVGKDISERRRQEHERQIIASIVQSVFTTNNLEELFEIAHQAISKITYAENCFIALHHQDTDLLHFDYWKDKFDPVPPHQKIGKGFSSYILKTGRPLLVSEEVKKRMYEAGEVEKAGHDFASFIGVPLRRGARTIGVLAVQHYEKSGVYHQRDLDLLATIGDQLALAIERKRTEIELKTSETRLREAQRISQLGSWEWEAATNKLIWSDEMYRIFGIEPQEFGESFDSLINYTFPEDRDFVRGVIEKAFNDNVISGIDHRIIRPDGTVRTIHSNGKVVVDENTGVKKMLGTSQDITERKQAEKEMERLTFQIASQRRRLNDILENIPCLIWEAPLDPNDESGRFRFVNNYITKMYGYTPEEWFAMPDFWLSKVHPDDRDELMRDHERLFTEGFASNQSRWLTKDGQVIWADSKIVVIKDEKGHPIGVRGVSTDITERKETEKALRTSEEQHRLLFESNPQPAFVFDLETFKFLAVNEAIVKQYGYSREEFLNTITLKDIRPEEDIPDFLERVSRATSERDVMLAPSRHRKKDGSVMDVEITSHVLNFAGKRAEIVLVNDVTERRKIEEKLRENEAKFRDLFDNAPIAYHELDSRGHFTRINKTEELMLGYTNEELKGRHPAEIIVEDVSREAVAAKLAGQQKLEPTERTFIRKDGTRVSVLCTDHLIFDADGKVAGIRTTLQDITERKKLERELQKREASYRAFIEQSTEGIWRFELSEPLSVDIPVDEQIDYTFNHSFLAECNDAMARMYGLDSAEDLLGARLGDLMVESDESNHLYFKEFVKNNYRLNDAESHETDSFGNDKYFLNNMVGIFENGKLASAWGTQRDITERRRAEEKLKIYNQKLRQSNRELQDFAYVASHDLQEPLRKVQAFADRLGSKYSDRLDATGLDYLERMRNAASRMQTLIQDLLAFSRVTTKAQPFVSVNLDTITREVLSDLEVKIEETGALIELENLPIVDADPSQMRQLMQNLIGNALKFHRKDTAPHIKISGNFSDAMADPNPLSVNRGGNGSSNGFVAAAVANMKTEKERMWRITVTDNGIGFDEKYLEKIFTVFQRLHGRTEYEGSGVGLAVCRKIVERHQGWITARSTPDEGASFIFTLPKVQSKEELN